MTSHDSLKFKGRVKEMKMKVKKWERKKSLESLVLNEIGMFGFWIISSKPS